MTAAPTTGTQQGQRQNVQGLATIAEANSRIMKGLGEHLKEMGVKEDVTRKAEECARMCDDIAQSLRR